MAASFHLYYHFAEHLANGDLDLLTDSFFGEILSDGYTPDQDAHEFQSDLTNEVSGAGYTAGGNLITSLTVTYANPDTPITGGNVIWSGVTFTNGRFGAIYDATPGSPSSNYLMGYVDFGMDYSPTGADFSISWTSGVILTLHPTS